MAKAQEAKIADEVSSEETAIDLAIVSSRVNNADGSMAINKETLKEELEKLQTEGIITGYEPTTITESTVETTATGKTGTIYTIDLSEGTMVSSSDDNW